MQGKSKMIWLATKAIVLLVQVVVSAMLVFSIMAMDVLSSGIIAVLIAVSVGLLVLEVFLLILRKKTSLALQIVCLVVSTIVIIASIIVMRYSSAFSGFLAKITTKEPEYKEYSVMVTESSMVKDVEQLNNKTVGFLRNDPTMGLAEKYLKEKVTIETEPYDDIGIINELMGQSLLEAFVLESSKIEALNEENEELLNDKRVIYTFEIELPEDYNKVSQKEITSEPFLIYVSGSDSRSGLQATARSDVNIVIAVNPEKGKIILASIPRDTYVQLHGKEGLKDKLTHAGLYGVEMSKTTIEDLLDIDIDHTVKVGFEGVVKIVDALDGIEIYSDTPMNLKVEGQNKMCRYVEGKQWVDGDCALRFARERKTYYTGDIHRGQNQQEVLTAIINKLSGSKDYLLKIPEILDAVSDALETSLSEKDITKFIRFQLANQTNWQIDSIAVSGVEDRLPTYSMGNDLILYVMHPDEESVKTVHERIKELLENK